MNFFSNLVRSLVGFDPEVKILKAHAAELEELSEKAREILRQCESDNVVRLERKVSRLEAELDSTKADLVSLREKLDSVINAEIMLRIDRMERSIDQAQATVRK